MKHDVTAEVDQFVRESDKFIDRKSVLVALDVGSRDAEVAIAFKRYFPNARVYAFECNPPAIELCRTNIGDRKDIMLVPLAVADVSGPVDFYAIDPERTVTPYENGNIGASSLYVANPAYPFERYYQKRITVEAITLREWAALNGVRVIDIVWMDLQGAELKVLRGLGDLIKRVKVVYTEVGFREVYLGQPLYDEIDQYLVSHGFRLHRKMNTCEWFGYAVYVRSDLQQRLTFRKLFADIVRFLRQGRTSISQGLGLVD